MPSINLSVPHQLGADEAQRRIQRLVSDSRGRFAGMVTDVEETWTGNLCKFRLKAMGFPLSGEITVLPAEAKIRVDLPLAALPFKSQVENELGRKARELLAAPKPAS
jgi:hypothetical protein